ncbi:MAG: uroporphyrinogen decarboxylase [Ruminococcaceae bacterium]|nr:uroporphyrinogen decarboxylase [Oscillospiraceae bacterium]
MKRIERVKAAIAHRDADKVPTCIHLAWDGLEAYADRLYERYTDENLRRLCDEGKISRHNAMYYGMGNHVLAVTCPWWVWHDVPEEYKEWDTPDFLPKTMGTGSYSEFAETVHNLKENTDAYVLVTIWGSHFEKAYFARGIENFLADMAGDPEYAQSLLDMIIRKNLVMLENIVHTPGIDGILLGSDWGSQKDLLMSPESWREMIAPGEQREYDLIHEAGLDVWVHSCGDIRKILPDLTEMGVDVLNPIQPECMDIYELKDKYGDKITFWGGISTQRTLPNGTPEEVALETEKITSYLSKDGGYIISPSQEIQADVPFENLCAMIDTAMKL